MTYFQYIIRTLTVNIKLLYLAIAGKKSGYLLGYFFTKACRLQFLSEHFPLDHSFCVCYSGDGSLGREDGFALCLLWIYQ